MNIRHQTWKDIEDKYKFLPEDSPARLSMLELVAHISGSDLSKSLHPWTSMFVLRITQTENHPFQDSIPFLQISPLNDGSAEFRYIDTHVKGKQWVRIADKGRLAERLESFIDQACWRPKTIN